MDTGKIHPVIDKFPVQGNRNAPSGFMLQKTRISSVMIGHLAGMQTTEIGLEIYTSLMGHWAWTLTLPPHMKLLVNCMVK